MFYHGLNSGFTKSAAFHWLLMSFLAGCVNAGGFLACGIYVTHITGFFTQSGIALASSSWLDAMAILTVPGFYLAGTMIAAWLTTVRIHRGLRPRYTATMAIVAACLLVVVSAGTLGFFADFGADAYFQNDYLLLALLCLASGLQNAAITTSSGATIRTTHLTGITTDLGIGLVAAYEARNNRKKYLRLARRNRLQFGTILSFLGGGAAGSSLYIRFGYWGFLLPFFIACYAVFIARSYGDEIGSKQSL